MRTSFPRRCYVDESVHVDCRFVVSAFVFASAQIDTIVASILRDVGLEPGVDEYKSSTRMTSNVPMQQARERVLSLAKSSTRLGVFVGHYERSTFGRHSLQALQSIVVRNAIRPSQLDVYFDEDIFASPQEARRLHALVHHLKGARIHPKENSKTRLGIQVADAVAASFGQIVKERLTGARKEIDIGGMCWRRVIRFNASGVSSAGVSGSTGKCLS